MRSAVATGRARTPLTSGIVEECWVLVGRRRGRIWMGRRIAHTLGGAAAVAFDGLSALAREERRGDVIGFAHTHPHGDARPSARDVRTMRAWCSALGKPLICVIQAPRRMAGYLFRDEAAAPEALAAIEAFPRGILIGVEDHGWQTAS